jgi:hypothetical protein
LLEWSEGSDEAPGLELLDSTESAADGTFAFTEVAEGSYVVEYAAPEVTWADLYYPSASSPFDAEDVVYSGGRLTLKAVKLRQAGGDRGCGGRARPSLPGGGVGRGLAGVAWGTNVR